MKIREGFVSNSSSSSFILLMDAEKVDSIKDQLKPLELAMLEFATTKSKAFGREVYLHTRSNTHGWSDWEEYSDNLEVIIDNARDIAKARGVTELLDEEADRAIEGWDEDYIDDMLYDLIGLERVRDLLSEDDYYSHHNDF